MTDPTKNPAAFQSSNSHSNQFQPQNLRADLQQLQAHMDAQALARTPSLESAFAPTAPSYSRYSQQERTPIQSRRHSHSSSIDNHPGPHSSRRSTFGHPGSDSPENQQQSAVLPNVVVTPSTMFLPIGKLFVTIRGARNITHSTGRFFCRSSEKVKTYAVIKLGGTDVSGEESTSVQRNAATGSRPWWTKTLTYSFMVLSFSNPEYNQLSITLYDKNRLGKQDILVGEFQILNLGQYITENGNFVTGKWYPMFLNGRPNGEILVSFDFTPMTMEDTLRDLEMYMSCSSSCRGTGTSRAAPESSSSYKFETGAIIGVAAHGNVAAGLPCGS